ncbi:hypothetical protein HDV00_002612 [Rhizophlyctis rosea]|nr:hypothetical protein HDV00_002612 [Rhizophlyctis rosea]
MTDIRPTTLDNDHPTLRQRPVAAPAASPLAAPPSKAALAQENTPYSDTLEMLSDNLGQGVQAIAREVNEGMERAMDAKTYARFFGGFMVFLAKRNLVDTGLGLIIGAAFSTAVQAIVDDLITPWIGLLTGSRMANWFLTLRSGHLQREARHAGRKFSYVTIEDARKDGAVTLNIGHSLEAAIRFVAIVFAVYTIWKVATKIYKAHFRKLYATIIEEANATGAPNQTIPAALEPTRECPYCIASIPSRAIRCKYCTQAVPKVEKMEVAHDANGRVAAAAL